MIRRRCQPDHPERFRGATSFSGLTGSHALSEMVHSRWPVCLTCQRNAILKREEGAGWHRRLISGQRGLINFKEKNILESMPANLPPPIPGGEGPVWKRPCE